MRIYPMTLNYCFSGRKTPVYAVSNKGDYKKYRSQAAAARKLGIARASVFHILDGRQRASGNYTFAYADKVETKDEQGNVITDKKVIEKLRRIANESSLYAVDKQGNYKKYESRKEASIDLGITHGNITGVLYKEHDYAKGYSFIPANEVEKLDADGNIYVDTDIIEKLRQAANKNDFYAINPEGVISRYTVQSKASHELGIDSSEITRVLSGRKKTAKGYIFIKANSIEQKDSDGNIVIDTDKIKKLKGKSKKRTTLSNPE